MVKVFSIVLFGALILGGQLAQAQQLSLSLSQAVELALKNNLQSRMAAERSAQSRGEKGLSLSALLPNVSGAAYQVNLTSNLAALGLPLNKFPGFPVLAGPFSRFDARFQLVQSIFDLSSIRRYRAAGLAVSLAGDQQRLTAQQITAAAALSYLSVLEAQQAVVTAEANLQLAARLLELARSQRDAGVATGVDVAGAKPDWRTSNCNWRKRRPTWTRPVSTCFVYRAPR